MLSSSRCVFCGLNTTNPKHEFTWRCHNLFIPLRMWREWIMWHLKYRWEADMCDDPMCTRHGKVPAPWSDY